MYIQGDDVQRLQLEIAKLWQTIWRHENTIAQLRSTIAEAYCSAMQISEPSKGRDEK